MNKTSKELISAMKEIESVIKKHNIAGCIFLANGEGYGEFSFRIDTPSWSMAEFIEQDGKTGIYLKAHMESKRKETEKTINSFFNFQGMIDNAKEVIDGLCKEVLKNFDIAVSEDVVLYRRKD